MLHMNRAIIFDFNRTLYSPDNRTLTPGAIELLEAAKAKGYLLILLSKAAADRGELVKKLGIESYFAEIIFANHKSYALFEEIAQRQSVDKKASYVIGDRAQGEVAIGRQAGWRTIWLQGGKFATELPTSEQQPDHTVGSLPQIPPLI